MGSGNRKSNTEYVTPNVAGGTSAVCPGRFGAVSMTTHAPVLADVGYEVVLAGDAVVAVKGGEDVASVLGAPGNLIAALGAGCRYVARFDEATDTGRVAAAEVLLIE